MHLVGFRTGDEKGLTKRGRRVHRFRPGTRAGIKRRFRRRERRVFKTAGDCISRFDVGTLQVIDLGLTRVRRACC